MSIKQISVFVENKPGALYGLTGVLAQNGVDLRALSLAKQVSSASCGSLWTTCTRPPRC